MIILYIRVGRFSSSRDAPRGPRASTRLVLLLASTFSSSLLRFQGVRHDLISESLRVPGRGLARRSMTRHHRLSRRRTPPRSRLHLRFESNSRATVVASNVPRTVPQRAIRRARDRHARSGRRTIGRRPSGGRSRGRSRGRPRSRRRVASNTRRRRGPRPSRSSGRRVAIRFPRGSAGALVSRRRGPRRRRRTCARTTPRGGRTIAEPRARGPAGTLALQLVQLLRRTFRIRPEPLTAVPSRAPWALTPRARRGRGPRRGRRPGPGPGPGPGPRGGRRGGPRSNVSAGARVLSPARASRVEPRSTAGRRDGGRGRVPADVRPDFGFHGSEPRAGRRDAGRGRSRIVSRVAQVDLATRRGRSRRGKSRRRGGGRAWASTSGLRRGGARAVPRGGHRG